MCVLIRCFNHVQSAYVSDIFLSIAVLITVPGVYLFFCHIQLPSGQNGIVILSKHLNTLCVSFRTNKHIGHLQSWFYFIYFQTCMLYICICSCHFPSYLCWRIAAFFWHIIMNNFRSGEQQENIVRNVYCVTGVLVCKLWVQTARGSLKTPENQEYQSSTGQNDPSPLVPDTCRFSHALLHYTHSFILFGNRQRTKAFADALLMCCSC